MRNQLDYERKNNKEAAVAQKEAALQQLRVELEQLQQVEFRGAPCTGAGVGCGSAPSVGFKLGRGVRTG